MKHIYVKAIVNYVVVLLLYTSISIIIAVLYNIQLIGLPKIIWNILSVLFMAVLFLCIHISFLKFNFIKYVSITKLLKGNNIRKFSALFFGIYLFLMIVGGMLILYLFEMIFPGHEVPSMLYGSSALIFGVWGYHSLMYGAGD